MSDIVQRLRSCADDPMWADHAEVPKRLCAAAADEIEQLRKANEAFGRRQEWWNERMFALEQERDRYRAALAAPQGEAVATLHDDGGFTWKRDEYRRLYDRQRAGWRMDVYAAPPQRVPPLQWVEAPERTQWGAGMMEALLPLGKDYTLRLYAERQSLSFVPNLFAPPQRVPQGWAFYSADFSLRAHESSRTGSVMLVRTGDDYRAWFRLPEEDRDRVPLYVSGAGPTVEDAITDAIQAAQRAHGIGDSNG
jgi:hypothetical protein